MSDAKLIPDKEGNFLVQTCPGRYPEHGESPDHDWEEHVEEMGDPNVHNGTRTSRYHVCRICGEEE